MKFAYTVLLTISTNDLEILTEGYGVVDAIEMAKDAIKLMLEDRIDHKENIPQPTEYDKIKTEDGTFCNDGDETIKVLVTVWLDKRSD